MEKLRTTIAQYSGWQELTLYVDRIEGHIESDFSHSLENAKALLEAIGKEICCTKNVDLGKSPSINDVVKKAFCALRYSNNNLVNQVSRALANIGQEIGELRNEISATSHGKSMEELRERNSRVDLLTREFLIDSTLVVAVFLIRAFEERKGAAAVPDAETAQEERLRYGESNEFNTLWDDAYGEFEMGDYSYPASEILYNVDYKAYETECNAFKAAELEAMVEEALEAGK